MSVANCKTVWREIDEADLGEHLTATAMGHLDGCGQCQRFYEERLKLRQIVASLETVVAPADFALRVRSRIASESVGQRAGLWFSNFTLGIPSVALAVLVLIAGLVVGLKVWDLPAAQTVAEQTETAKLLEPTPAVKQSPASGSAIESGSGNSELAVKNNNDSAGASRDRQPQKRSPFRSVVAAGKNDGRVVTKEFSSTPARVIRKEEAVASLESVFPIETSSQPLRVSLDYSGGVSRTISVPALSFGSERVLSGGNLVKSSSQGAW